LNPLDYIEKITKNVASPHCKQCKYIAGIDTIYDQSVFIFPHKKEELSISIQFEEEDKLFKTNYSLEKRIFPVKNLNNFIYKNTRKVSRIIFLS